MTKRERFLSICARFTARKSPLANRFRGQRSPTSAVGFGLVLDRLSWGRREREEKARVRLSHRRKLPVNELLTYRVKNAREQYLEGRK